MRYLIFLCLLVPSIASAQNLWVPVMENKDLYGSESAGGTCSLYSSKAKEAIDSLLPGNTIILEAPTISPDPNDEKKARCLWDGSGLRKPEDTEPSSGSAYFADIVDNGTSCPDEQGKICKDDDSPPQCPCDGKDVPQGGNPINILAGSKTQRETFFSGGGAYPLRLAGTYNSSVHETTSIALEGRWTWNHTQKLLVDSYGTNRDMVIVREGGQRIGLSSTSTPGNWTGDPDIIYIVEDITGLNAVGDTIIDGYKVTTIDDTVEEYDRDGFLTKVTNRSGLSHFYSYNAGETTVADDFGNSMVITIFERQPIKLIDPDGFEYQFQYNGEGHLEYASFPDYTPTATGPNPFGEDNPFKEYHYEDTAFINALTGITDEEGIRYQTWDYDSGGRAITSEHDVNIEKVTFDFSSPGLAANEIEETNALGKPTLYRYQETNGQSLLIAEERLATATSEASTRTVSYDTNGFKNSETDFNGNETNYSFDTRGLEQSRTEAFGTSVARTITTTWHPEFRKPTQIVEPGKTTTYTYDTLGHMLTMTETDTTSQTVPYSTNGRTRTTTYTYYPEGVTGEFQLHTIDGARTDVSDITTYTYTTAGYLESISNALSHLTQITSYNSRGLPLSMTDSNGVVTNMTYHPRGWLLTTTVVDAANAANNAVTTNEYDDIGQLTKVIMPNGAFLEYEYDDARRLNAISNNLNERQEFTYDNASNITAEISKNSTGSITRTQSRVYDDLSRISQVIGGASQVADFTYDANSNQTISVLDPLGLNQSTVQAFDALDRMSGVTDAISNNSGFIYDNRDNLISVTDQRGLTTTYTYDGLDNLIQLNSPDTGITVYILDDAGNQTSSTDARGVVTSNTFDALGRLTAVTYPTSSSENIAYVYDQVAAGFGVGRLTQITDQTGSTAITYDNRGNEKSRSVTIQANSYTTAYAYDLADNLTQTVYPSGRIVDSQLDGLGRVAGITTLPNVAGSTQTLASNIDYLPFGPMNQLDYGNGLGMSVSNDLDYRVTSINVTDNLAVNPAVLGLGYTHNAVDNITAISDGVDVNESQTFIYDLLNRLEDATGDYGNQAFTYDGVGNRLSLSETDGGSTVTESYTYDAASNRLLSVDKDGVIRTLQYDANGNIISDDRGAEAGFELEYDDQNRLIDVTPIGAQP